MTPTVGRIVHFYSAQTGELRPAIITRVFSETCVNLEVFGVDVGGPERFPTSVLFDASLTPQPRTWVWPPKV